MSARSVASTRLVRRVAVGAFALGLSSFGLSHAAANAAEGPDTSHGRVDGDLAVAAGVGAAFGPRAPRVAVDLRLRYLWTVGLFAAYEDAPIVGSDAEPRRAFAAGLELRPLFLARWLTGRHSGSAHFDLAIDSFAIELGAVLMQPEGAQFGSRPGLQAGLGLEVPILPHATGPFVGLHGGARWSDAALGGRDIETASDRALYLLVTLGFQKVFGAHLVDHGDRASR